MLNFIKKFWILIIGIIAFAIIYSYVLLIISDTSNYRYLIFNKKSEDKYICDDYSADYGNVYAYNCLDKKNKNYYRIYFSNKRNQIMIIRKVQKS